MEKDQEILLKQCEQHMAAAHAHAAGEKKAKQKVEFLNAQLDDISDDLEEMEESRTTAIQIMETIKEDRDALASKYSKLKHSYQNLKAQ